MKMSTLGVVMLGFITVSSMIAFVGSWLDNGDLILCAMLMMLQFLTIAVKEGIRVLREIRDKMNGER